mmetsp:Transcript_35470/g.82137  ORF Transcript_35470/g.82137 Transcript_35470/m.82137 type:complete len:227 (+) Transcript_35470:1868-2548(+)
MRHRRCHREEVARLLDIRWNALDRLHQVAHFRVEVRADLRHAHVVHPYVRVADHGLPLLRGDFDALREVRLSREVRHRVRHFPLHHPNEQPLEAAQLVQRVVRMLERGPLVAQKEHRLHRWVPHYELAPLPHDLVGLELGQLDERAHRHEPHGVLHLDRGTDQSAEEGRITKGRITRYAISRPDLGRGCAHGVDRADQKKCMVIKGRACARSALLFLLSLSLSLSR